MIVLSPKRITIALSMVAFALALINVIRNLYQQATGVDFRFGHIFSYSEQVNIPVWYSSSLMLLCSLLFLVIAWDRQTKGDRFTRHWKFLSILFVFMSVNELVLLYRRLFIFFIYVLPIPGKQYIGLLLLTAFLGGLLFAYRRFLAHLPKRVLGEFLVTLTLYFFSAVIDKLDSRNYWQYVATYGTDPPTSLLTTIDEMLELAGVIILIHAVLLYISLQIKELHFHIADS